MDTIFALASGRGRAGVAVVRVSGPAATTVLEKLTDKPAPKNRMAAVREIWSLDQTFLIDEALVLLFRGPGSFTGEDVLEIHLHGGPVLISTLFAEIAYALILTGSKR